MWRANETAGNRVRKRVNGSLPVFFPLSVAQLTLFLLWEATLFTFAMRIRSLATALTLRVLLPGVRAMEFGASKAPVSALLSDYSSCVDQLKKATTERLGRAMMAMEPYSNDVFYLRFCLSNDYDSDSTRLEAFVETLTWRHDDGKQIIDAARVAASEATKEGNWNYESVHRGAPTANGALGKFFTPSKILTIFSPFGDPVFCMHHGQIDDKALMKSISSPKEIVDFMIYTKEVNAIVANRKSLDSDRLAFVLTANNLNGASLSTGDRRFRNALNESARFAAKHYPSMTGPTLMLNLPSWLTSFARAFAPSEVSHTLRFAQGPLKNVDELTDLSTEGPQRSEFFGHLNKLVYDGL